MWNQEASNEKRFTNDQIETMCNYFSLLIPSRLASHKTVLRCQVQTLVVEITIPNLMNDIESYKNWINYISNIIGK